MPSSFHSTAAGLTFSIAAATSAAGEASIGRMPRPTCSPIARSASAPPAIAVAATAPRSPCSISARRRSAGGHVGGARGGLGHHALERALADAARQQRAQERLLAPGRAPEQRGERRAPRGLRARARRARRSPRRRRRRRSRDSEAVPTGGGASRTAAQPTPIWRWRSSPDRNATAIAASSGEAVRSASASTAILPLRALVALTVSEAATRSASSTTAGGRRSPRRLARDQSVLMIDVEVLEQRVAQASGPFWK